MSYQILVLIAPLITVPYVSRVLGAEGVGINTFTNSIVQYFVLLGSIGITLYGSREIAYVQTDIVERSKKFWEIEMLKGMTVFIAYLLYFGFLCFYGKFRLYLFYQSFLIVAAGVDISWFYMGIENFKRTVARNTMVKIIGIMCVFIFVKNESDIGLYILLLALIQLLGNLTLWPYLRNDVIWPGWNNLKLKRHLKPALQLFIPQIAIQVYWILNRTMLGQIVSVQASGFFQYADQFIKMALSIVTATGPVLLPRVSNAFSRKEYKKVYNYTEIGFEFVSMLAFPMAVGIIAIANKFAPWFMGEEFNQVGSLMVLETPIIIFIAWSGVIGQQFLLPTKRVPEYTVSVTIGVIINVLLNIILIYPFGTVGAMIATVVSEFSVTAYQLFRVRDELNILRLVSGCWPYLVSSLIMYIPVSWLINHFKMGIFSLLLSVSVGVLVYGILMILFRPPVYRLGLSMIRGHVQKRFEEKQ
ncbi:PST family polysaccharide transporter [Levilactobacillus koreensis JCM 16448]|nr:PST family polysaccharide transporter [Levilactobacillus koreensis JCM 16448]